MNGDILQNLNRTTLNCHYRVREVTVRESLENRHRNPVWHLGGILNSKNDIVENKRNWDERYY